jgi:NAD(P)-dependent dehydrogenase (short-subunit alcohol dehydrogenase family)
MNITDSPVMITGAKRVIGLATAAVVQAAG